MSPHTLARISIVVSAILAVATLLVGDLFWVVVAALNIVFLAWPIHKKHDFYYSDKIVISTIVPAVLELVFIILQVTVNPLEGCYWIEVPADFFVSTLFQSMMAFSEGLLLVVLMDREGTLVLTKRWMILYAMMFALMISVISLFFTFVYLYEMGIPVFNGDVAETGFHDSNNKMMTSAFVTTFATPFYALAAVRCTHGKNKDIFTVRRSSE